MVRKNADGFLQLFKTLSVVRQETNRKLSNRRRNMVPQDSERRFTLGGNQHTTTGSQIVANDIGDGMRLAGPRRSLHHHAIGARQLSDDGHLLIVEWLREEKIFVVVENHMIRR